MFWGFGFGVFLFGFFGPPQPPGIPTSKQTKFWTKNVSWHFILRYFKIVKLHNFTSSNSGKVSFPDSRPCVMIIFFTGLNPKHEFYSKLFWLED